ncbi:DUF7657 domain-containing protein [Azospirillum sp. sgz301742]
MVRFLRWPGGLAWFAAIVLVLCTAYTALHWTPSSYALALRPFGVADTGLIAGKPKPIRSDEWAVWTPYVQAAVNNGFERTNATSPYREDMRNFNAVPLLDWALPFKPQYWLFFVADPALAFSFSHAIFIAMSLIGYAVLLRVFGFPALWSIGGSLALFFTTYAQYWWTTTGPLLAVFPWILVAAATPMRPFLKAGITAYLSAFWLLSHTYPPIVVSLGIAGAVALAAFRPQTLRPANLLALAAGAAVGVGLTYLYLHEPAAAMAQTIYPGQRQSMGGTMEPARWFAQFFPLLVTRGVESVIPALNLCEAATGGTYLLLLALVFVDHRAFAARLVEHSPEGRRLRWTLAVLLAGTALFTAWMLAPIPAGVGRLLLLDRVPPGRAVFASGMVLLLTALTILTAAPVRVTLSRVLVTALAALLAWAVVKAAPLSKVAASDWRDFAVLLPLFAILLVPRLRGSAGALVGAAAFANIVATGDFNPIQSADPLFHRTRTPVTEELDRMVAEHPRHWLVATGFPGATLNGWGYPSVSHVTIAPRLDFFRERFPEMDDAAFNAVFNRYARVNVLPGNAPPSVPQPDSVDVPVSAFLAPPQPIPVETVTTEDAGRHPYGGFLDAATGPRAQGRTTLTLLGWGLLERGGRFLVRSSVAPVSVTAEAVHRPDVVAALGDPRLIRAGFRLTLAFDRELPAGSPPTVCVLSQSPAFGTHLLQTPEAPDACRDLAR